MSHLSTSSVRLLCMFRFLLESSYSSWQLPDGHPRMFFYMLRLRQPSLVHSLFQCYLLSNGHGHKEGPGCKYLIILKWQWKTKFLPGTRGLLFTFFLISTVCKWLAEWLHFIRINSSKISPFCFSNTPDVPVVFGSAMGAKVQRGSWLTVPERGQVASLTDSLICCILHCCSSPANRGN